MTYWQQHKKQEALAKLERAHEVMQLTQPGNFDLVQLRREAEKLLDVEKKTDPRPSLSPVD